MNKDRLKLRIKDGRWYLEVHLIDEAWSPISPLKICAFEGSNWSKTAMSLIDRFNAIINKVAKLSEPTEGFDISVEK